MINESTTQTPDLSKSTVAAAFLLLLKQNPSKALSRKDIARMLKSKTFSSYWAEVLEDLVTAGKVIKTSKPIGHFKRAFYYQHKEA